MEVSLVVQSTHSSGSNSGIELSFPPFITALEASHNKIAGISNARIRLEDKYQPAVFYDLQHLQRWCLISIEPILSLLRYWPDVIHSKYSPFVSVVIKIQCSHYQLPGATAPIPGLMLPSIKVSPKRCREVYKSLKRGTSSLVIRIGIGREKDGLVLA